MKTMLKLLSIVFLLSGCNTLRPTPEQFFSADFGIAPDKAKMEYAVKSYWQPRLIDPTCPLYNFTEISKGWINKNKKLQYGYWLKFNLNAKNGFGGYTGPETYSAFFINNKFIGMYKFYSQYEMYEI